MKKEQRSRITRESDPLTLKDVSITVARLVLHEKNRPEPLKLRK